MSVLPIASAVGIVVVVVVIVAVVAVIAAVFVGIGRVTRREEREGTVKPPDDPTLRPPRA